MYIDKKKMSMNIRNIKVKMTRQTKRYECEQIYKYK